MFGRKFGMMKVSVFVQGLEVVWIIRTGTNPMNQNMTGMGFLMIISHVTII